jgi:hypothetical protein
VFVGNSTSFGAGSSSKEAFCLLQYYYCVLCLHPFRQLAATIAANYSTHPQPQLDYCNSYSTVLYSQSVPNQVSVSALEKDRQ